MTDRASAAVPQGPGGVDPLIGRVINDRFRITGVLARGGMGKIYRAEQAPLGRVCALKVLSPSSSVGEHDGEFHKRFFLEASIAAKLTHPNTVTIFDYGRTEDDIYFMAMEYLDGSTLQRAIRTAGFFPEDRATHITRQICRALREAHSLGVIHRDLKPANIFLVEHGDEADFVKVLDFGLVKNVAGGGGEELTRVGVFVGSPKYMAPEQIRGDRVDVRTDIYALGTILYEMVSGKVPFTRASTVHIMVAQVNEPPPPLRQTNPEVKVSAALEEAIMRCLAKDPDQRFASMDEVLGALKRLGNSQTMSGTNTGPAVTSPGYGESQPLLDGTGSGPTAGLSSAGLSSSISPSGSRPTSLAPAAALAPPVLLAPAAIASIPISIPVADPPSKARSRAGLGAVALAALGVAGLGAFLGLHSPPTLQAAPAIVGSASAAPSTSQPTATSTPTAAPGSAVDAVSVRINTDPDGAEVKENGNDLCSSTPCDVPYAGSEGDPNREHRLVVTRAGYRTEARTIKVGDSPVVIRLTKIPDATHTP